MDETDHGGPPEGGWSPLAIELLVEDLDASLAFWRDLLGFAIAYRRPVERFVYLERPDGAQIMLAERAFQAGRNETAAMARPYGRGVMFQLSVDALEPVLEACAEAGATVHEAPHEEWRRIGDHESGRREVKLLDPDGYLVMIAEDIGRRTLRAPPARRRSGLSEGEHDMSDLVAISFDSKEKAQEALERAVRMQKSHLLDLADAVIVTRDENGKVRLQQTMNLTAAGAATGGMWGTLIGLLFLNPLVGLAVGAASGALAGSMSDIGIDDRFMKDMGDELQPGTSALFVLVRKSTPDRVLPELRELGGKVFTTSLSKEDERALREALEGEVKRRMDAGESLVDERIEREHAAVDDGRTSSPA